MAMWPIGKTRISDVYKPTTYRDIKFFKTYPSSPAVNTSPAHAVAVDAVCYVK